MLETAAILILHTTNSAPVLFIHVNALLYFLSSGVLLVDLNIDLNIDGKVDESYQQYKESLVSAVVLLVIWAFPTLPTFGVIVCVVLQLLYIIAISI